MKIRQYRTFVADFETTVYENQTHTEVWAAALVEIGTEDVSIYHSLSEFLLALRLLKSNLIVYFHNLKFDGNFILDYLIRNGYEFNRVADGKMMNNQYKCSIAGRGQWYTITIKLGGNIIEIRDSLKLLPFSVNAIGESFKTKHKKLDMTYEGFRYAGCEITDEEKKYIKNDVLVVKEALEIMFQEGHTKLTIGSCCMEEFKKGYDKTDFSNFFPDLTTIEIDKETYGEDNADAYIRHSYKGGYCYLVKGKENKIYQNGWTADINSSYPSNMSSESGNYYPVGKPCFWQGDIPDVAKDKYYFVRLRCRFHIKSGFLPTIQIKGNLLYNGTDYLMNSDVMDYSTGTYKRHYTRDGELRDTYVTLTLTCVDYELFLKHYHVIDLQILDGCWFYKEIGLFDDYMYRYKTLKESSTDAVRELAKLYLNNLYGKFASNTDSSWKKPKLNEKGLLSFETIEEHEKEPGYIAVGSAITSYARAFVINASQANYNGVNEDGFIYCDTDSIHCSGDPKNAKGITIHPTKFCCWKMESYWDEAVFVRQKTYVEHVTHKDGKPVETFYNIRCAGMGDKAKQEFIEKHTIEEFKEELELENMLKPVRMHGGIVLVNKGFKMKQKIYKNRW